MLVLAPFSLPGGFFKGNLHTHSTQSDGAHPPAEVCRIYRDAGYDFIALTDHFMDRFGFPLTDTRGLRADGFTTLLGAELHVGTTSMGEVWHVLAVGLPPDFAVPAAGETTTDIAARAHAAGAFVAIVHPAWYGLTPADAETVPQAHAVEIYNHTSQVKNDRGDSSVFVDTLLARGRRVSLLATDDAHFNFDDAFGGWVMVKAADADPDSLLAALKAGHFYASQGPEIRSIAIDGDTLSVACSPAAAIMLLGRGSKAENVLGQGMTEACLPLDRVRRGGVGRVVVTDAAGRRAWSNPIWFD